MTGQSSSTAVLNPARGVSEPRKRQGAPRLPGWLRGNHDLQYRPDPPPDPGRKFHRGDHADRRELPHGHRHLLHEAPRGRDLLKKIRTELKISMWTP